MKKIFLICFIVCINVGNLSASENLKQFILSTILEPTNVPFNVYSDEFHLYMKSGDITLSLNKEEYKSLIDETASLMGQMEINDFRILSRSDTEHFTSVTYEYNWNAKQGNTNMSGKISNHMLLEKTNNDFKIIFEVSEQ